MHYFAFGVDLEPAAMRSRSPEHRVVGVAALRDHRLAFTRYVPEWGGGVASLQAHHGDAVWGVVLELSDRDIARLDELEGFRGSDDQHNRSDRRIVTVDLTRPDDQSVPRRLRAFVYVPRPSNPSHPSSRYLETLVRSATAWRLPEDYVARLRGLPVSDPSETAGG
jgi:gamma-glutamylcyclotransferase (GGCT)/AIG2-like uncharacterized protein YtfP